MSAVDKLLAVARAEVGYLEKASNGNLDSKTGNAGYNNYTKYAAELDKLGNIYNGLKNGYYWCDVFVDWCFIKAFGKEMGVKMLYQPLKGLGAGCTYSAQYFQQHGAFFKNPQPGDQIFFSYGDDGYDHTGIVTKVANGRVYTIEGNTSGGSGVVANGGGVFEKSYPLGYYLIGGYGRPNYKLYQEDDDMTDERVLQLINSSDPMRHDLKDVPAYWREDVAQLVREGAICGDGKHQVEKRDSQLAAMVAMKRHAEKQDPIYRTISDVPEWGRPSVQALIDAGKLAGECVLEDGTRILNIRNSTVRIIRMLTA